MGKWRSSELCDILRIIYINIEVMKSISLKKSVYVTMPIFFFLWKLIIIKLTTRALPFFLQRQSVYTNTFISIAQPHFHLINEKVQSKLFWHTLLCIMITCPYLIHKKDSIQEIHQALDTLPVLFTDLCGTLSFLW